MACIFGGIAASHTPTIGFALDNNKQTDPVWQPIFEAFEPAKQWLAERKPDAVVLVFNDPVTFFFFFFDHYSAFSLGVGPNFPVADHGGGGARCRRCPATRRWRPTSASIARRAADRHSQPPGPQVEDGHVVRSEALSQFRSPREDVRMTKENIHPVALDADATGGEHRHTIADLLEITQRIERGLPVSEIERAVAAKFAESVERTLTQVTERQAETFALIGAAFQGLRRQIADQIGEVFATLRTVGAALAPALIEWGAAMREMPPRLERAVVAMAHQGWYVDGQHDLSDLWALQAWIDAGETAQVDEHLMTHFERRLQDIERELIAALPKRAEILRAAFAAHRRGEYVLSVPVLLTQADGACIDLTDHHLFLKSKGSPLPAVATYLADAADQGSAMFLGPMKEERLPLLASEKARQRIAADRGWTTWTELNRHQVLHGESVDHGTQLNSLKAVSLLSYLVHFLPDDTKAAAEVKPSEVMP